MTGAGPHVFEGLLGISSYIPFHHEDRSLKILIISQYFPPEMGAAATRWSDYARLLVKLGHQVVVLTEVPNYPAGVVPPGYSAWKTKIERDPEGLYTIVRAPVWANPRRNSIQRLGFFLSFMASASWLALRLPRFDMTIVSSPPLFVGVPGMLLNRLKRASVFLDLRDIWPESAVILGELKNPLMIRLGHWLERRIYRSTKGIFFAVPGFIDHFKRNGWERKHRFADLINGVSQSFFDLFTANISRKFDYFTVVYAGNFGLAQKLSTVVDVAEKLRELPIRFLLIGDGVDKPNIVAQVTERGLENIEIRNPVKRDELNQILVKCHVALVPLIDSPLFERALPSKIFEFMAAELPVVVAIRGEVEALLQQSGGGVCVEPENVGAIAAAIERYHADPQMTDRAGKRARQFIKDHFIKETLLAEAIQMFTEES